MFVALRIGTSTASVAVYDATHGAECVPNAMGDFKTPVTTARAPSDPTGFVVGEAAMRKRSLPTANATPHVTALADLQSWTFNHRQYHGGNTDINDDSKDRVHAVSLVIMSLLGDVWRRISTQDTKRIQVICVCLSQFISLPIVDSMLLAVKQGYDLLRKHTPPAGKELPAECPAVILVPSAIAVLYSLPTTTSAILPVASSRQFILALRCGGMSYSATVLQRHVEALADSYGSKDGLAFGEWKIISQVTNGPQAADIQNTGQGGEELDRKIMSDFCSEHAEKFIMSPLSNKKKQVLLQLCQEAKLSVLSSSGHHPSPIEFDLDEEPLRYTLTMETMNALCRPLCDKMMSVVAEALVRAQSAGGRGSAAVSATGVTPESISHVVTYGGSINLPPLMSKLSTVLSGATVIDATKSSDASSSSNSQIDPVAVGACAFSNTQNLAQVAYFNTPSLAGDHFEESTTEFALLVELHGGTYGMLMAPYQKYPVRAVKEMAILQTRPSAKNLRALAENSPHSTLEGRIRLIATKCDMQTFLCEVGTFQVKVPSTPAPKQRGGSSAGGGEQEANPLSVEVFVEVGIEGCVRIRVQHHFSACQLTGTFGPVSQLAAPL